VGLRIFLLICLQAATKRKDVFTKAGVPNLSEVIGARVSILRPLRIGQDYGIVLTPHGLMVGHGMYTKSNTS
jgi:hypothetical protein